MDYIHRYLLEDIVKSLENNKLAIIFGARQTGKTTLTKKIIEEFEGKEKQIRYYTGDDPSVIQTLQGSALKELEILLKNIDLLIIDEAQRIENIGLTAKLIHDNIPNIKLVLTGSSSLDLANKVKEPLTGRAKEYMLFPLSATEITDDPIAFSGLISRSLRFGGYPQTWTIDDDKAREYLTDIANNYIYRDIFDLTTIYDKSVMKNLLKLLSLQIGNEVSYNNLANKLSVSKETAMRYISLLENSFIVFRMNQYRKNQRSEIGKLRKIYFYDLGIRNSIINNFSNIEDRSDVGALWENFCILERMKKNQKEKKFVNHYYWRNRDQEIDLIETSENNIDAFEFKFSQSKKIPLGFKRQYPEASFKTINNKNYFEFIY
jgi:predicted AAA+ superfamily ATPase